MPGSACEEADDDGEQSGTLDKSGSHDHVRTEITADFGLTGHRFEGASADATNADTSTNGCDTCTNASEAFGDVSSLHEDHCEFHKEEIRG